LKKFKKAVLLFLSNFYEGKKDLIGARFA
ncbi:MAG: hypothetical protein ACI90V_006124, partial [Bacillariaceae sp.]